MKWWLLVGALLLVYVVGKPHQPGAAGILLDADGDYYLEFKESSWSEGFLDPHQTLTLYLCKSNGWFQEPIRTQLWVGDSEGKLSIENVKFLPRDPARRYCVQMELPTYINSGVTPGAPPSISQNGNILTYCYW
jgi:hypothetical protein